MMYKSQLKKLYTYDWFCGPGSHIVLDMDNDIAIYRFQCYFMLLTFELMPYMLEYEST